VYNEYYHGLRFREHPLIRESPRNVLFLLSIDGVPIFKDGKYSLWILTVSPANLTRTRRAKKGVIPLLVIDGPMEPKHVHLLLQEVLADLRQLSTNGTRVWDALSKSYITVKAGPVCCHNDLPASSRFSKTHF
jgi:hypothetical protein